MKNSRSQKLFTAAKKLLPGGVNSPVRAFKSVGGTPHFFKKAQGSHLTDVDGNKFIDYVGSWGPMILGHRHPKVIKALNQALKQGMSFGAPSELEVKMAAHIVKRIPSIQKIRMVNSGTEAVLGALRAARGFTGKNKILKFEGCYHGHGDYLLVKAGSGALTLGSPDSLGVPKDFAKHTLVARYNDFAQTEKIVKQHHSDLAAIIVEPIVGNMGCVLPQNHFLKKLRQLCDQYKVLLVFDEVMTGFRVAPAGAQGLYKIKADLTTLGKIIGGGLPVGAYGGREEIMNLISPEGAVYQAGTLSGNPLAMAAGLATLEGTLTKNFYSDLKKKTQILANGLVQIGKENKIPIQVPHTCGMLSLYFSDQRIDSLEAAQRSHIAQFKQFHRGMLEEGIYLPPSAFEAWFLSSAHKNQDLQKTLAAARKVFKML